MIAILKTFAEEEGVGYQVLMKRWLDDRIRQERALLATRQIITPKSPKKLSEPLIVAEPDVMIGKPVIAGTRITVELILEKLGSGEAVDQLLDSHPRLTREGIFAALRFAARALGSEIAVRSG